MEQAASHVLVPKHVVASEQEVKQLLDSIGKPVEALPIMLADDPALSGLNAKPGDVIRIERTSPVTQETTPYYRLAVEE